MRSKHKTPKYPQNPCIRFGQSRLGPVKRTALDGDVWWCIYDYRKDGHVPWCKFRKRRQALAQLAIDLRHNRLPYEPDSGFSFDWFKTRTNPELRDLVDRREPAWIKESMEKL